MKPSVRIALLVALLVGVPDVGHSKATHQHNLADKQLEALVVAQDRYVDLALELTIVERAEDGQEVLPGRPPVRILGVVTRGGRYDTLTRSFCGPAITPIKAFVSQVQCDLILHEKSLPNALWVEGSMGGGKTTAGGLWLTARVIENATRPIWAAGVTAPTDTRAETIRAYLFGEKDENGDRKGGLWSKQIAVYREGDRAAVVCTGLRLEFRSTHVSSHAAGSPLQGQSFGFALCDEEQDYFWADGDIQMRGRNAWQGRFRRLVTITLKDDPGFREFRAQQLAAVLKDGSPLWHTRRLIGPDSPFVHPTFWEERAAGMTVQEAKRKIWAEDVPSESRVYTSWDRQHNLRELPIAQIPRWEDVTHRELARFAHGRFDVLVGTDPGRRFNVSILLKAYQPPLPQPTKANPKPAMPLPRWFVIDEVTTERNTYEHHAHTLLERLRQKYGVNMGGDGARALVRMDPMAKGPNDEEHPDQHVFKIFRNVGLHTMAAAYQLAGAGHSWVPREARIDMINTLLCNSFGERRLFVACDHTQKCVAPRLVDALERQERDGDHRAERAIKGSTTDTTHWSVSLGYALWAIEKPRLDAMRGAA